jgi:DNA-binding MarR family transcriptional regulator
LLSPDSIRAGDDNDVSPARTPDPLIDFGFLLKDVSRLYSRNFERLSATAGLGLTLAQCRVLSWLHRHEGASQARLADLTDTDPMTLRRLLLRMEADGLVERHADPADRRAHRLVLGRAARPLVARIHRLAERARADALAELGDADRAVLATLLQHIRGNLGALVPEASADEDDAGRPPSPAATPRRRAGARPC